MTHISKTDQGFSDVVLGTQYGDEGKARVIDDLSHDYDIVARFNGGANAGHTVESEGVRLALRQVPSAVLHKNTLLYVGSGCVVDLEKLKEEIQTILEKGITLNERLKFSSLISVVQPHHKMIDGLIGEKVGTTKNGIGPAYADRMTRMHGNIVTNIRLADLTYDQEKYFKYIKANFERVSKAYNLDSNQFEQMLLKMKAGFEYIKQYIEPDTLYLQKKCAAGKSILFEGAQSFMLDVNKGSVPYVTSSSTIASAAYNGGDLSLKYHRKTIGVVKVVMSRVGYGPFTSELGGSESEKYCMEKKADGSSVVSKTTESTENTASLISQPDQFKIGVAFRILSNEYGTVTGRPRRVGVLDLVQLKQAVEINGIDELVLTKCDLLLPFKDTLKNKLPIVVGYQLNGKPIDYIPGSTDQYADVKPIIEYLDTFDTDVSGIKKFSDLPAELHTFIDKVSTYVDCKIRGVSVGPDRSQYIPIN